MPFSVEKRVIQRHPQKFSETSAWMSGKVRLLKTAVISQAGITVKRNCFGPQSLNENPKRTGKRRERTIKRTK